MLPHPLTNFEKGKYYQEELKFKGVCSRIYLPKIKESAYVIKLDEYKSINGNNVKHFDSLELKIFQKKFKNS